MSQLECLTSDKLTRFLKGEFVAGERAAIETHLSHCRLCRRQLVSLYEDVNVETVTHRAPGWVKAEVLPARDTHPSFLGFPFRFRFRIAAIIAAVAILALTITAVVVVKETKAPSPDVLRQESELSLAPRLLAPAVNQVLTSEEIDFRWSTTATADSFTFTVLDEKGDIVFQTSTAEQSLRLSISAMRLERGRAYFWYVELKSLDKPSADSQVSKFRLSQ